MFAAGTGLPAESLPELPTNKALIVINMQNDISYTHEDFYVTKNRDIIPRLKKMIPYFRKIGHVIWVRTVAATSSTTPSHDAALLEIASSNAAEKNRQDRLREESGLVDDVSNDDTSAEANEPTHDLLYPSSRSKKLMMRLSADLRAKKRDADASVFDDTTRVWPEQLTKPRKGQRSKFFIEGTRGAEILDELKNVVDESKDTMVVKHFYSAFDQTSLLMSLRMNLTTEVYLCGCFTNTGVYTTAADAVQHGLDVSIVEDCLGYRNELRHDEAVRQMADVMGVNGTDSEEIIEESGGHLIPGSNTPGIRLEKLSINPDITLSQAALVAGAQPSKGNEIVSSQARGGPIQERVRDHTQRATQDVKAVDSSASKEVSTRDTTESAKKRRERLKARSSDVGDVIGSGDSTIIYDALSSSLVDDVFEAVKAEVDWRKMYHRSGEVPRLVAVQGVVGEGGEVPIYRHPADESPPLKPFTPHLEKIKSEVEQLLSQPFNHALIQLYRGGTDNISEHSDKTLDLVRDSRIINVSLGAQRVMTLRAKKSGTAASTDRQTQRIKMPHNSVFVLGPRSNQQWLHGVRADKRPSQEKSAEELAFDGARISITLRQIGTFYNGQSQKIWGSGAKSKKKSKAHRVSKDEAEVDRMLQAFGRENHETIFDWKAEYGSGFDVVDLVNRKPELVLTGDAVANLRVQLALSHKAIKHKTARSDITEPSAGFRFHPWTHGLSNVEKPLFKDLDQSIEGDLAILFHLEKQHPAAASGIDGFSTAQLFRCAAQSNELLYIWREFLIKPPSSPTHRFKLELRNMPNSLLIDEIRSMLNAWEEYFDEDGKPFVAGQSWTILDCAFWPVLHRMKAEWTDFPLTHYPRLVEYHKQGLRVAKEILNTSP